MTKRIRACIREDDLLVHLGDQCFAVILANVGGKDRAKIITRRISSSLENAIQNKEGRVKMNAQVKYYQGADIDHHFLGDLQLKSSGSERKIYAKSN